MIRPLAVRCGAFGDMVLLTALIRMLHARFHSPVDIVTSGPWSEPLLRGQPGIGEIWTLRSRKTPYWLSAAQRTVVRRLRARLLGCGGRVGDHRCEHRPPLAHPPLQRGPLPEEFSVKIPGAVALTARLTALDVWPRYLTCTETVWNRAASYGTTADTCVPAT